MTVLKSGFSKIRSLKVLLIDSSDTLYSEFTLPWLSMISGGDIWDEDSTFTSCEEHVIQMTCYQGSSTSISLPLDDLHTSSIQDSSELKKDTNDFVFHLCSAKMRTGLMPFVPFRINAFSCSLMSKIDDFIFLRVLQPYLPVNNWMQCSASSFVEKKSLLIPVISWNTLQYFSFEFNSDFVCSKSSTMTSLIKSVFEFAQAIL